MRAAFVSALAALTPTFTAYERPVSSPSVPCGFPFSYEVDYTSEGATLNGCGEWTWLVVLLASRSDDTEGQAIIDDLADGARDAIQAIPAEMFVSDLRIVGTRDFGGVEYLAVELTVRCLG
jgi:hypothetical protein